MKKLYSAVVRLIDRFKLPVSLVRRSVLQGCLLTLILAGLTSQVVKAQQLYILNSNASNNFQAFDLAAVTSAALTSMTPVASGNAPTIVGVGNYIYAGAVNQSSLRRYDVVANTWTSLAASSNITTNTKLFTDGTSLYQKLNAAQGTAGQVSKFDATAGTWSPVASLTSVYATISGVGVVYVIQAGSIKKYDPVSQQLITLTAKPSTIANNPYVCADANKLYFVDNNDKMATYNLATNTWTNGATVLAGGFFANNGFVSDGTFVYGKYSGTIYKYDPSTDTYTTLTTTALAGGTSPTSTLAGSYYVPVVVACTAPTISASVIQATCTGSIANSNGTIMLTAFSANATKVDFTIGSTYTGSGFASATALSGSAPYTVTSTLPNPTVNQPYTIRVYCDATNYTDKTVLLTPKQCQTADLSLSVSPATQTGNSGEFLTYTVTLTNAGPNTATNVGVNVPMPDPTATLLSATAASGTYNSSTKKWTVPSLPVGNTTLSFTVKVN